MSADGGISERLVAFLTAEINRKEQQQCTRVELLYAQPGCRDQELMSWVRRDDPDAFELVGIMDMVSKVISRAEGEADAFGNGRHRFTVRTHKAVGASAQYSFAIQSAYNTNADELALVPGGGPKPDVVTQNNQMLGRLLQNVVQGSYGVLGNTNTHLAEENRELRTRVGNLEKDLDAARSLKEDRGFEIETKRKKFDREEIAFKKLIQFGTLALAKLGAGSEESSGSGTPTSLAMVISSLGESLRENQINIIFQTLDDAQRAMFAEAIGMAQKAMQQQQAQEAAKTTSASPNGANGNTAS